MLKLKKRVFRLPRWSRRFTSWLAHRVHNLTRTQRIVCASVAGVLLLSVTVPTALFIIKNQSYKLSTEVQQLIGTPNENLSAKITYNSEKDSWQFNQSNIPIGSSAQQADMPSVADLKAQIGGTGKKDESLYAVDMPSSGSKGVTYYDTNTDLSFSLVPQFKLGDGRRSSEGHIVYPSQNGTKLIYTAKANGMKEDIVLTKPIGDELEFSYKLNLPDTLTAKIQDDGSLGVFSPNPILFGNISTGNGQDKEKILSARKTAAKDHLLFVLPAPVIVEAGGTQSKAPAKFTLSDGILTVKASGLADLHYPLSIDPSVVVTSSSDFAAGNGDNISYDTDQISRAKLTGATLNSWATTTAYANAGTSGVGSAAYNGYIYAVGGNNGGSQEAEVEYAPINSDGTIGSWTATTDMSIPRTYHGFTVYNGYAYALGGSTTGWSIQSSTEYAPINSNGTIGSWTSTTAFPTERTSANAVAYNGYMYLIGGLTNSGVVNSVLYAPIKADGSLGSWNTTSSFTTARCNSVSFASNGRMYVIGGYDNSSAYYSDTQYATINADGTLGSWTATTSYTTARAGAFGGTYGGYAYLSGGTSNANSGGDAYGDTQYAQINADGTLGSWRTMSATLTSDRFAGTMSFYKGYVYAVGGVENGGGGRTVQYAAINPAGTTTNFGTVANNFTTARALACSVAYNGYLYAIGGSTNDSSNNNIATIRYTSINSSTGNVGTWNTTTALPEARGSSGCTAYGGYLYVVGGYIGTNVTSTLVRYAPINSDGTIGTWVTTAPNLPLAKARPGVFTYATSSGTYLYSIGGDDTGAASNNAKSYYALIGSSGSIGSWSTASNDLTTTNVYQSYAQVGKYIYAAGGWNSSRTTEQSTVEYTTIQSNGDLGSWSTTTSLGTAVGSSNGTTVNGCIYAVGGETSLGMSAANVQYACPAANGTISAWNNAPNLSVATTDMGVTSYNGYIYGVGGYTTSVQTTTQFAAVNNGGSGGLGSWTTHPTEVTSGRHDYAAAVYGSYLYITGGEVDGNYYTTGAYAKLNSDGSLGSWTSLPSMNTARAYHGLYTVNGYLYAVLGYGDGGEISSSEYAKINSDGSLGSWTTTTAVASQPPDNFAYTSYNGYIYTLGGNDGSDTTKVLYANVSSGGDFSSWSTTTAMPSINYGATAVAVNGYMYVLGGGDNTETTKYEQVISAPINSNGTLGSWSYTTSLPFKARVEATAYNGFMYAVMPINGPAGYTEYTLRAPIYSGGTLGAWEKVANVAGTDKGGARKAIAANGYLYALRSGVNVYYAPISSIARTSTYEKTINLSGGYALTSIAYGGTLSAGLSNITYKAADSSGSFGSSQAATDLTGTFTGCTSSVDTMYVRLRATLDDSRTAIFPDALSSPATITDMTVNYQSPRDTPNQRLMHGKFFSGESKQALDTCGS